MPIDIDRLAKALRMQKAHLAALLEHPERDASDFHLALAGVLRSMLCDGKNSTLLEMARQLDLDLRVWGPFPPSAVSEEPPAMAFTALVASATPVFDSYEMSVAEYVDAPIGASPTSLPGEFPPKSMWYTPRQLIKSAADKEGPAHLDPKPAPSFVSFGAAFVVTGSVTMISGDGVETPITENDNITTRAALIQISQLVVSLCDQVLMQYEGNKLA
jgi:hypothetical protein